MKRSGVVFVVIVIAAVAIVFWPSTAHTPSSNSKTIIATIHPLAEILRAVAGDRLDVATLLPPAASPHTFSPRPSDVHTAENALAIFYVSQELDGWATKVGQKHIRVLELLPQDFCRHMTPHHGHHEHGENHDAEHEKHDGQEVVDPHFWMDPQAVKSMLPAFVRSLTEIDPEGKAEFEKNADTFAQSLDVLDQELKNMLQPIENKAVFLFHPSVLYMTDRYHLQLGGLIEPFPGKIPSPQYINTLTKRLREENATAIFTEPQLSDKPAKLIAAEAKELDIKIWVLDPIGGVHGRMSYREILTYNAQTLLDALK